MRKKGWLRRAWMRLYSKIVREKASPEYIARGWAIGMFYGCFAPMGTQLLLSIPTAFLLRGSKIGATIGTFLTNYFTVLIIYPVQCYVGSLLMGGGLDYASIQEAMAGVREEGWRSLLQLGPSLIAAFFIGGALLTAIMTPTTYIVVKQLVLRHRARRAARAARANPPPAAAKPE